MMVTGKARAAIFVASASVALGVLPFAGSPAGAAAPGPYSGYAHASAVHVDAITNGSTRLANVDVAVANAAIDSAGLEQTLNAYQRPILDSTKLNKKSYASSELLRVGLAGAPDAPGNPVNVPAAAVVAAAPGEDPLSVNLLDTSVSTVARALLLKRTASPAWNGSTCVIGAPIAEGTFEAARLEVADLGPDSNTPNFDKELVGIAANSAGPERDAVNQVSLNQLYDGAGAGFGLMSATMSTLAPVTLFEGDPKETTIELLGPAVLRAMADGTPGGAKIEFDAPAVSIIQNGTRQVILPTDATKVISLPGPDGAVLDIRIGQLTHNQKASNGTSASAKGSVVQVKVLSGSPAPAGFTGATIAIGHVEAATQVPAGGILCPIRVEIDADPETVPAGKTIDVTTTVFNDFECPLINVNVVDTLTTDQDASFTITEAAGALRKSAGSNLRSGEIAWLIPRIEAGKKAARTFTVRMDTGPGKLYINGTAFGALANCPATPGGDDASVSGLGSGSSTVRGSANVSVPITRVLGGGVVPDDNLPSTGVASTAAAGLAMLTTAGGLVFGLRRRSAL